jgi:CBS domain-containing protein
MGNKVSNNQFIPSVERARNSLHILEYSNIKLSWLQETFEYWSHTYKASDKVDEKRARKPTKPVDPYVIERAVFDDLFTHLFKDTEEHFAYFRINDPKKNTDASDEFDEYKTEVSQEKCNILEVLCIVGLLTPYSMKVKVEFLFNLIGIENHYDGTYTIKRDNLFLLVNSVLAGASSIFTTEKMDRFSCDSLTDKILTPYCERLIQAKRQLQLEDEVANNESTAPKSKGDDELLFEDNDEKFLLENDTSIVHQETKQVEMKFDEFWLLCQDSTIISVFLDAISAINSCITTSKQLDIPLTSAAEPLNMNDSEEVVEYTQSLCNSIFTRPQNPLWTLSILAALDTNANCYTSKVEINEDDNTWMCAEYLLLAQKEAVILYSRDSIEHLQRRGSSFGSAPRYEKSRFIGVITLNSLMGWLVHCLPVDITAKDAYVEQKRISYIHAGLVTNPVPMKGRQSIVGSLGGYYGGASNNSLNVGMSVAMKLPLMASRARNTINDNQRHHYQDFAEKFVVPVKSVFTSDWYKRNISIDDSKILQPDNCIFDAIRMITSGHKFIPIADPTKPNKVTLVLTVNDIVTFVRTHCFQLLGRIMNLEASISGMLKEAFTASGSIIVGNALHTMVINDVDACAIVDDDEKLIGRLSYHFIESLLVNWHEQTKTTIERVTKESLLKNYAKGTHKLYDGNEFKFSALSVLFSPIKHCDSLMIYKSFDAVTRTSDADPATKGFIDIQEESESGSSDSDSDSNSSTSSSHSSNSSTEKKKKKNKNKVQGKKNWINMGAGKSKGGNAGTKKNSTASIAVKPEKPSSAVRSSRSAQSQRSIKTPKSQETSDANILITEEDILREKKLIQASKIRKWLTACGAILETDTLGAAIEVMHETKSTRAFVVNEKGFVKGVINFTEICKEILAREHESKMNMMK